MFGVHLPKLDMLDSSTPNILSSFTYHRRRQICANNAAARTDLSRRREEHGAPTGGHIKHGPAGRELRPLDKPLPEMGEDLRADAVIGACRATKYPDDSRLPITLLRGHGYLL